MAPTCMFYYRNVAARFSIIIFVFMALVSTLSAAHQPADLTSYDVEKLMNEMLSQHPMFQSLTPELTQRILKSFANELDPMKSYLTRQELREFLIPTQEEVLSITSDLKKGRFALFSTLFRSMPQKVERMRGMIEKIHQDDEAISSLQIAEKEGFQDWVENEAALYQRLKMIESARKQAISHFKDDVQQEWAMKSLKKLKEQHEKQMTPNPALPLFEKTLMTMIMKAFSQSLDSQTMFLTPGEAKQFMIYVQQRLFGIGVLLRDDFDGLSLFRGGCLCLKHSRACDLDV